MIEGQDPIGSMGRDIPLASLSDKSRLLYDYFFQKFAQVTNPPIDPIREEIVMSLKSYIGPKLNIFDYGQGTPQKLIEINHPVLSNLELNKFKNIEKLTKSYFKSQILDITCETKPSVISLDERINHICEQAEDIINNNGCLLYTSPSPRD